MATRTIKSFLLAYVVSYLGRTNPSATNVNFTGFQGTKVRIDCNNSFQDTGYEIYFEYTDATDGRIIQDMIIVHQVELMAFAFHNNQKHTL